MGIVTERNGVPVMRRARIVVMIVMMKCEINKKIW